MAYETSETEFNMLTHQNDDITNELSKREVQPPYISRREVRPPSYTARISSWPSKRGGHRQGGFHKPNYATRNRTWFKPSIVSETSKTLYPIVTPRDTKPKVNTNEEQLAPVKMADQGASLPTNKLGKFTNQQTIHSSFTNNLANRRFNLQNEIALESKAAKRLTIGSPFAFSRKIKNDQSNRTYVKSENKEKVKMTRSVDNNLAKNQKALSVIEICTIPESKGVLEVTREMVHNKAEIINENNETINNLESSKIMNVGSNECLRKNNKNTELNNKNSFKVDNENKKSDCKELTPKSPIKRYTRVDGENKEVKKIKAKISLNNNRLKLENENKEIKLSFTEPNSRRNVQNKESVRLTKQCITPTNRQAQIDVKNEDDKNKAQPESQRVPASIKPIPNKDIGLSRKQKIPESPGTNHGRLNRSNKEDIIKTKNPESPNKRHAQKDVKDTEVKKIKLLPLKRNDVTLKPSLGNEESEKPFCVASTKDYPVDFDIKPADKTGQSLSSNDNIRKLNKKGPLSYSELARKPPVSSEINPQLERKEADIDINSNTSCIEMITFSTLDNDLKQSNQTLKCTADLPTANNDIEEKHKLDECNEQRRNETIILPNENKRQLRNIPTEEVDQNDQIKPDVAAFTSLVSTEDSCDAHKHFTTKNGAHCDKFEHDLELEFIDGLKMLEAIRQQLNISKTVLSDAVFRKEVKTVKNEADDKAESNLKYSGRLKQIIESVVISDINKTYDIKIKTEHSEKQNVGTVAKEEHDNIENKTTPGEIKSGDVIDEKAKRLDSFKTVITPDEAYSKDVDVNFVFNAEKEPTLNVIQQVDTINKKGNSVTNNKTETKSNEIHNEGAIDSDANVDKETKLDANETADAMNGDAYNESFIEKKRIHDVIKIAEATNKYRNCFDNVEHDIETKHNTIKSDDAMNCEAIVKNKTNKANNADEHFVANVLVETRESDIKLPDKTTIDLNIELNTKNDTTNADYSQRMNVNPNIQENKRNMIADQNKSENSQRTDADKDCVSSVGNEISDNESDQHYCKPNVQTDTKVNGMECSNTIHAYTNLVANVETDTTYNDKKSKTVNTAAFIETKTQDDDSDCQFDNERETDISKRMSLNNIDQREYIQPLKSLRRRFRKPHSKNCKGTINLKKNTKHLSLGKRAFVSYSKQCGYKTSDTSMYDAYESKEAINILKEEHTIETRETNCYENEHTTSTESLHTQSDNEAIEINQNKKVLERVMESIISEIDSKINCVYSEVIEDNPADADESSKIGEFYKDNTEYKMNGNYDNSRDEESNEDRTGSTPTSNVKFESVIFDSEISFSNEIRLFDRLCDDVLKLCDSIPFNAYEMSFN